MDDNINIEWEKKRKRNLLQNMCTNENLSEIMLI